MPSAISFQLIRIHPSGFEAHTRYNVGGQTYGVAKNVSLVAVRVLDCNGTTSGSQLIEGLDWVVADHQATHESFGF